MRNGHTALSISHTSEWCRYWALRALVDNAINDTPAGGLVGVKVCETNGRAVLEVNDNGVGVPPEAAPHIFERFYRVDKARSRQMGGAGLGLSIVKAIVTAHGGQVKVESVEGRGSRFLVELPIANKTSDCRRDGAGLLRSGGRATKVGPITALRHE
jgi:signal transduction histidine kinase